MNVILLEKVHKLGELGETVSVKSGYGRNFLIPKGIAVPATGDNVKKFEEKRADLEKAAAEKRAVAEKRKLEIEALAITIPHKAGEEGKLFGSVGTIDIAEAASRAGISIQKQEVRLPLGVLREVGQYDIGIELHGDIVANLNISIVAE
ncbi:MAG: 50S ribosomal protein L9 [Thiohalomonadales bacterium]